MKKLYNFNEYNKLFEEFDMSNLTKKAGSGILDLVFADVDLEKILVNSAQIISILSSFFGKTGMKISFTIETVLLLYWLWKYNNAPSAEVKEDALIQLVFASFGFVVLGATPAFKAISSAFSKGYKEYKLTGSVAKIQKLPEFKILSKNKTAIKEAAATAEKSLAENLEKIPQEFVSNATKSEIKETAKGVKKYVDDVFETEAKTAKKGGKVKGKEKIKGKSKIKTAKKLVKLGRKLMPIASYLLNRFLNKKKKPEHLNESENDFIILKYQIGNEKITGADFPRDLEKSDASRMDEHGKVVPTIIGLKILIEDIDSKSVVGKYNILSDFDTDYEYYLMCATNGEPIYNNFKLFAMKDKHIMISKLVDGNIQFVDPHDVIDEIRYIKTITSDEADFITVKNLKKVIDTYEENLKETNSYIMWSKIIANTFTRAWWDKNFKLKVSNDKK